MDSSTAPPPVPPQSPAKTNSLATSSASLSPSIAAIATPLVTENWYTSRDSKTTGPFSFAEVAEQISSGRLTLLDLIYSEAQGEWKLLSEVVLFQKIFQTRAIGRVRTNEQNRGEWIILKAQNEKSSHVLGPFHQNEIFEMISSGELSYSDSVWKPGEEEWVRLGDHASFDRRKNASEFGLELASHSASGPSGNSTTAPLEFAADTTAVDLMTRQEILMNVTTMRKPSGLARKEILPEGAAGEDLTKKLLSVAFIGFCLSSLFCAQSAQAHTLEIAALKSGTAKPLLVLQTDAPVGTMIHVELTVALGDVPNVPKFSKTLDVQRAAGEMPTIDVESLDLPKGKFHATARLDDHSVKKSVTFFNGESDPAFRLADSTYAKEVSFQQQAEKKALFYASKRLGDLAKKLRVNVALLSRDSVRRRSFALGWARELKAIENSVSQISVENGVALPSERNSFAELVAELKSESQKMGIRSVTDIEASPRMVASVTGPLAETQSNEAPVNDAATTAALSKLESEFTKLKEQTALASAND